MNVEQATLRKLVREDLMETLIRVVLIAILVVVCVRVFMPFSHLVLLGIILAISMYPLYVRILRAFGGRRGLSATALVLGTLLLLGVPMFLLGGAVGTQLSELGHSIQSGQLTLKVPDPKVAEWPVVGKRVYTAWNSAATNMPAFLQENREVIGGYARKALSMAAAGAGAALLFVAAIIVAGVLMTFADAGGKVSQRILVRLTDPVQGPRLQALSIATIRSVATGVVGVAVIQSVLLGMGFLLAGIPGAGVLALLVLFLGILQLPALLISLPVVGYLWWMGEGGTVAKVIFTIWFLVAGMADNVLKPLLLGRGVDAPMLVILIGAIGGMVTGGITGLFLGAVLLAVGYQIFMEWVDGPGPSTDADELPPPVDTLPTDHPV